MVNFNMLILLSLALLVMAALIMHNVSALVVGVERANPFNVPYYYVLGIKSPTDGKHHIGLRRSDLGKAICKDWRKGLYHKGDLTHDPEPQQKAAPLDNENNEYELFDGNGNRYNNEKRSSRIHILRRGCIPRGGACDNRPNDCCYNSSCRCNLWGNNCRCQRMGLFQKWG